MFKDELFSLSGWVGGGGGGGGGGEGVQKSLLKN